MAYLATIVRVGQDFAGISWVRYEVAFQRQAALTGHKRWSVINPTLYTTCFAGMTAARATEWECTQRGDPDPDI
jgi:hypothetical protein